MLTKGHVYEPVSVTIFDDSQSAIALAKNPVNHQRSKHIDIKYHFVRDEYNAGKINIVYLPTADMITDMFTKPVSSINWANLTIYYLVIDISNSMVQRRDALNCKAIESVQDYITLCCIMFASHEC